VTGFLIDTHVMLWWATGEEKLSSKARLALGAGRNELFFSYASIWELNIKISRGRLELPESPDILLRRARCKPLPIGLEHLEAIKELPHLHRDPFDRMLIAQARVDHLTLITRDIEIQAYDVATMAA